MRRPVALLLGLLCFGCALDLPGKTGTTAERTLRKPSTARLASPPAGGLVAESRLGLLEAIQNTLAAGEVARSQATIGLIANNGGSIISNNGGGLISNNGGGVLIGGRTRYQALQLPEAPGPLINDLVRVDGSYVYRIRFFGPDYRGDTLIYAQADHEARGDDAEVLEYFKWDKLGSELIEPTFPLALPLKVRLTYPIQVEKSFRVAHTKRMTLITDNMLTALEPIPRTTFLSMTAAYAMEVPLLEGGTEQLTVNAHDFTYRPGQGPGEGDQNVFFFSPTRYVADGENARGRLEMVVEDRYEQEETFISASYTLKGDGRQFRKEATVFKDQRQREVITDVGTGLEVVLDYAADRTGSGVVRRTGTDTPLGSVSWTPDGRARVTFDDGEQREARLF